MELNRLSLECEQALERARDCAERQGDAWITPLHVLSTMLDERGVLRPLLDRHRVQCTQLLETLAVRASEERPGHRLDPGKRPIAGPSLPPILNAAFDAADRRGAALVEPVDFLTAVLDHGDAALQAILRQAGLTAEVVRTSAQAQAAMGAWLGKTNAAPAGSLLE